MRFARTIVPWVVIALICTSATTAEARLVFNRVVVRGKTKTHPRVLASRMKLRPGDLVDLAVLSEAEKRLVETDLFSSVDVYVDLPKSEAVWRMYLDKRDYLVDVQVEVVDRVSQFMIPVASFGSGDWAGGFAFADQNLFGHDAQLVTAGQIGLSRSYFFMAYRDPLILDAPITWGVSGIYRYELIRFFENHSMVLEVPTIVVGGEAQIGWVLSPHTRALFGFVARHQTTRAPDYQTQDIVPPPYNARGGRILVAVLQFVFDSTSAPEGLRTGVRLILKNELSDQYWGSEFDYSKIQAHAELYGHVGWNYPSLVLQSVLDYPTSLRGVPVTEMVRIGGSNLRGFLVNEFHGDTLLSAQAEDQVMIVRGVRVPLTETRFNLAAAAFVDVATLMQRHPAGTTAPEPASNPPGLRPSSSNFHVGVGGGARVILPGVAIPALKVDLGYGIDVRSLGVTVSIAGGGI